MGAYSYRALDASGRVVSGVIEGESPRQVRQQLRQRELRPIDVDATVRPAGSSPRGLHRLRRLRSRDLTILSRQLAILIESGMPLAAALQSAASQSRKTRVKSVLLEIRSRIVEGHTLAYALGEFPATFNTMYRAMVRAGESAGHLGPVLQRLADHAEQQQASRQKVRAAMLYPLILIGVALLVVSVLMTYVVPDLIRIFSNSNAPLPFLTRALIASTGFLERFGALSLALAAGAIAGLQWLLRRPRVRGRWHSSILRMPVIGELVLGLESARYCSALSILTGSGVPLLPALGIAAAVLGNESLRAAAEQVQARVEQGARLHQALEESNRFPLMMVHLIASGEASGTLQPMLARAAANEERDADTLLATLMALLEPLLVVMMGGFVLVIVLAVLMPIFDLNTLVR